MGHSHKIKELGWDALLGIKELVYPDLVQMFFSNMKFVDDCLTAKCLFLGWRLKITVESLNKILGFPNIGIEMYSYGGTIEYPEFSCHMCMSLTRPFSKLPYGMVITKLALVHKVDLPEFQGERANSRPNFNKKLLNFMGLKKVKRLWVKKEGEAPETSSKAKRVKTRASKKNIPPSSKSLRLTTIKETSLEQCIEEDSNSIGALHILWTWNFIRKKEILEIFLL